MRLYNTLTQEIEPLTTVEPGVVRMYCCGPTVYNFIHIGNFRTFVLGDFLRRALRQQGWQVIQVMNITDVDDKTIHGAAHAGIGLGEFTRRYEESFFQDLAALNVERAENYPRATEHIAEMAELVGRLTERGLTYESDGSIYFRISAFPEYGRLSRLDAAGLRTGARVDSQEYGKEEARDFVLWKHSQAGEVGWETALGFGRPGWHLECSAMSMKYLGETFDLHLGAVDLVFPHHENEIAQSEAATGQPFVRHWVHGEFLQVSESRMGKSVGNQLTLRDVAESGQSPLAVRMFYTTAHYRQKLNFTDEGLRAAAASLQRLRDFRDRLRRAEGVPGGGSLVEEAVAATLAWDAALADDLSLPTAVAAVFDFVRVANRVLDLGPLAPDSLAAARTFLDRAEAVLGVMPEAAETATDPEIDRLVADRETARRERDFARADELRDQLRDIGIVLEDSREGVRWRRA